MLEEIPRAFPVEVTRKWRELAQRRKAHLVDLYNSGRWRLYYTEPEYLERLREAVRNVDQWRATELAALAGAAAEIGSGESEATTALRDDSPPIDGSGGDSPSLVDVPEHAGFSAAAELPGDIDTAPSADPGPPADERTAQSEPA
jgi:uncharacterized repeat protein (TIGR03809 family)